MTGEVNRLEGPVLRQALLQELARPALLNGKIEGERLGRLEDRGLLVLVVQRALAFDLGRHEQQRHVPERGCDRLGRLLAETPCHPEQALLVRCQEHALRRQKLPGDIQKRPFALGRIGRNRDLELDLTDTVEDAIEPAVAFVQKSRDLLPDASEGVRVV